MEKTNYLYFFHLKNRERSLSFAENPASWNERNERKSFYIRLRAIERFGISECTVSNGRNKNKKARHHQRDNDDLMLGLVRGKAC